VKPIRSAYSSMKKSKGLMTLRSAIRPTVMVRLRVRVGKTRRAWKLPKASCCQLTKWSAGSTCSEYASMGVRECGAGRSRTTCGNTSTRRSNV
jgi:hypothetical protein